MFESFMQNFVSWLDPKLEKYRPKKPAPKPQKYTPATLQDFIDLLRRTPKNILNDQARARISAVMSFNDRLVADLMIKRSDMVFVKTSDILGPLVLDKLYKSGFTVFPVVDNHNKVKGIIRTEALNTLEIKKTDRADKYLDKNFNFIHATDSLSTAVQAIETKNSSYFLVLDHTDTLVGFFTIEILLDYLLGK